MSEEKYLGTIVDQNLKITYESFLNEFIRQTELLSCFAGSIWDEFFVDIDIYSPQRVNPAFVVEWFDRAKIEDQLFNLQCAELCKQGVYSESQLHGCWTLPTRPQRLIGENQTAEALVDCRNEKHLIAALFIAAALNSKTRQTYRSQEYFFTKSCDRPLPKWRGKTLELRFETRPNALSGLHAAIADHLKHKKIWNHWSESCTSLVPVVNDRPNFPKIFSSLDDLAAYLAERFILLSSKYAVCIYSHTQKKNDDLLAKIETLRVKKK